MRIGSRWETSTREVVFAVCSWEGERSRRLQSMDAGTWGSDCEPLGLRSGLRRRAISTVDDRLGGGGDESQCSRSGRPDWTRKKDIFPQVIASDCHVLPE